MDRKQIENKIKNEYINFVKKYTTPTDSQRKDLYNKLLKESEKYEIIDYQYFFIGNLELLSGNESKALEYFNKSITENKVNPFPYNSIGLIHFRKNNIKNAQKYYRESIEQDNEIYFVWYNLGRTYEYLENFSKAYECYNHAIILYPDDEALIVSIELIKIKKHETTQSVDNNFDTDDIKKSYKSSKFINIEGFFIFADIRGFTKWSKTNDSEIESLFNVFYPLAANYFGEISKDTKPPYKRIVKFLGDGFFAVKEYKQEHNKTEILEYIIQNIRSFAHDFKQQISEKNIVGRSKLNFGFGITYGKAQRFKIKSGFDWTGNKVNYAARFCSVADKNEIILEEDFQDILTTSANPIEKDIKNYGKISVLSIKV